MSAQSWAKPSPTYPHGKPEIFDFEPDELKGLPTGHGHNKNQGAIMQRDSNEDHSYSTRAACVHVLHTASSVLGLALLLHACALLSAFLFATPSDVHGTWGEDRGRNLPHIVFTDMGRVGRGLPLDFRQLRFQRFALHALHARPHALHAFHAVHALHALFSM